ncbi:MAG: AMP-binding protein [Granulosicoccus sp.]
MSVSEMSPFKAATSVSTESITELINRQAHACPDHTFLLAPDTGLEISYLQLQQQVRAVARFIKTQGVVRGASVAYAMHNGPCCAITVLGIIYGGYRAVAINLVAGRDVIAYVLAHSQTSLVLTEADIALSIDEALGTEAYQMERAADSPGAVNVQDNPTDTSGKSVTTLSTPRVIAVNHTSVLGWIDELAKVSPCTTLPGDDALLMYTSGTTGRPKGVTLSHTNLVAGGQNVVLGHELSERDRALCVLPLYHINGLCVTLLGPLVSGGSIVLPKRFSTSAFWQLVDEHQCSWFSVVPTQIAYLLRDADASADEHRQRPMLRFGRSASAPLSPDVHGTFERQFGIPLIETMGLTETAAQILTNPLPPLTRKSGSPGIPVGDEVIIVNKQLQPVANGVEGELLVRGPNVMQRYFRNEAATTEALVNDGWLRTGDLGRKDDDGYIFVTGRLKELIIKGGENIAPREIDDALYQHADVVEAAAFACPCDDFGQRVEAAVVLKTTSSLREADLIDACEQRIGRFKCPDRIHFLNELPKGPSGKIQRARIRDVLPV